MHVWLLEIQISYCGVNECAMVNALIKLSKLSSGMNLKREQQGGEKKVTSGSIVLSNTIMLTNRFVILMIKFG